LLPPARATATMLSFEFTLRTGDPLDDGSPNFLGEYVQGPRGGRFVFLNSGSRGGDTRSCWDRRAKLSLQTITAAQLDQLASDPSLVLEGRVNGVGRDGGPVCATTPLIGGGWSVVPAT